MTIRARLIFLLLAFCVLVCVGRMATGGFDFLLTQFWFASGFFLLLLLSLVDQPHFSKDANVFVNAATAWVSLLLVPEAQRSGVWWAFFAWAAYLIVSSYVLMLLRGKELKKEPRQVQVVARVNRQIGRPEAIFSAFFLWGAVLQFGNSSGSLAALFLFWAVFMILNLPSLSSAIDDALAKRLTWDTTWAGTLDRVISPDVVEAVLSADAPESVIGRRVELTRDGRVTASAIAIDDRIIADGRVARLVLTSTTAGWAHAVAGQDTHLTFHEASADSDQPISVVDSGSEIGKLVLFVHPRLHMQSGEVLYVRNGSERSFYQAVSAVVVERPVREGSSMHAVKVTAGELGIWVDKDCRFEPTDWVAPAGALVSRVQDGKSLPAVPEGMETVGRVPNSSFPVHVDIKEAVTHNTAIIGVTGSGKSFMAFALIEAMVKSGIKVLILDTSRQHYLYLRAFKPTPLTKASEVEAWYQDSSSPIGIFQFGAAVGGLPKATADFVDAAFKEVEKTRLLRGKNIPAKLCIVFEEAHALVPEWSQVAQKGDEQHVNRTCRTILQGRKYGMGTLLITQRTANVTKTILNQCNTIFAMQSFDQTGLDFLRNYMGEEYSQAISTLPKRHAILVGKASSSGRPIVIQVPDWEDRWVEVPEVGQPEPETPASIPTVAKQSLSGLPGGSM